MITMLIAYGPNSIEIPCRIFESMEDGRAYCDPLFAKVGSDPIVNSNGHIRYSVNLESVEGGKEISEELFTSHYYGCGDPGRFILQEVPFNEKFVVFDLD
jgi:hypothetical protein